MTEAFAKLRRRLPKLERWVVIALVLGILLVAYSGFQGRTWWKDSQALAVSKEDLSRLQRCYIGEISPLQALEDELRARQRLQEDWESLFVYEGYPETDHLMGIVLSTGNATGVTLKSMILKSLPKDASTVDFEELRYNIQTLALVATGDDHNDISQFLSQLYLTLPSLRVAEINMTGFAGKPQADMVLEFYLEPGPPTEDQAQ